MDSTKIVVAEAIILFDLRKGKTHAQSRRAVTATQQRQTETRIATSQHRTPVPSRFTCYSLTLSKRQAFITLEWPVKALKIVVIHILCPKMPMMMASLILVLKTWSMIWSLMQVYLILSLSKHVENTRRRPKKVRLSLGLAKMCDANVDT
jgi:hypothetical protein